MLKPCKLKTEFIVRFRDQLHRLLSSKTFAIVKSYYIEDWESCVKIEITGTMVEDGFLGERLFLSATDGILSSITPAECYLIPEKMASRQVKYIRDFINKHPAQKHIKEDGIQ